MFLTAVTIKYNTTKPIALDTLPEKAQKSAHGIRTVPEPKTGKMSTTVTTAAIISAYLTLKNNSPKNNSAKLISIILKYPLKLLVLLCKQLSYISP
jgi:hypothetical protein